MVVPESTTRTNKNICLQYSLEFTGEPEETSPHYLHSDVCSISSYPDLHYVVLHVLVLSNH